MNATKIHCGYVIDDATGDVYLQVLANNPNGFQILDDDRSWAVPPFASWTAVADDDPRVSDDDRERLGWILDDAR